MPIYEYKCKDCGKISEFFAGVSQQKLDIKCEYCGSRKMSKIFSKSYVITNSSVIGSQGGKTCCGRDERGDSPPCADDSLCKR